MGLAQSPSVCAVSLSQPRVCNARAGIRYPVAGGRLWPENHLNSSLVRQADAIKQALAEFLPVLVQTLAVRGQSV
jgi:hypothetical protein